MNAKEYINSINTSLYSDDEISVVLYDPKTDTHLYLFNFKDDEEGKRYCTLLNEPISEEMPYVELSLPFIDTLQEYYGTYQLKEDSDDIGKNYKEVMKRLKDQEKRLLR